MILFMEEPTGRDKLRRYIRILAHLRRIAASNVSIDRILD
jgi:hypothetical protein